MLTQLLWYLEKCPPGSPMQETKRLCMKYWKLNTQLSTVLGSKSPGAIMLVDIPKIDEMLAWLHSSKFFTSLDLRSGHYHIKLSPQTRHEFFYHHLWQIWISENAILTSTRTGIFYFTNVMWEWYFQQPLFISHWCVGAWFKGKGPPWAFENDHLNDQRSRFKIKTLKVHLL